MPTDDLSLHVLQGPEGEAEGRVQAREFAAAMEQSIAAGGTVNKPKF